MELYISVNVPESVFPMDDADEYGHIKEAGHQFWDAYGKVKTGTAVM